MSSQDANGEEVGYGRPPMSGQFEPGRSGNPNGRPKKPNPCRIDLNAVLDSFVEVGSKSGPVEIDSRELELRQQINKALDMTGSLKAARYVLEQFAKYQAIVPPEVKIERLVFRKDIPWGVSRLCGLAFGRPPFTDKQYAQAKAHYLAERNEGDRIFDVEMGYEPWLQE
jgi:hypothetical protein